MRHLTAEQLVDIAEGTLAEVSVPHLASCEECRRQLGDLRAMMAEAATVDVPEPSPLFWDHLSARVSNAVQDSSHEGVGLGDLRAFVLSRLTRPRVWIPALAGAIAVAVLLPRTPVNRTIPSTPLPVASKPGLLPSLPPIAPLGSVEDPQLRLVASSGSAVDWDEMRDEMAAGTPARSDAVAGALTVDEQRELERLLAEEMAQPTALENAS